MSTRIADAFPTLIESKRGSSTNGGGTWIDQDLGIQLLIWVKPEFALDAGRMYKKEVRESATRLV